MTEPMEATVDMTLETAATDNVSEETEVTEQNRDVAKAVSDTEEATAESAAESALAEQVYTPVYNGAVIPVKASDTARVTTLLQKGMKFEHMAGELEKLHRLKAMCGTKSVAETIDVILNEKEQARLREYEGAYGTETAKHLMELETANTESFREAEEAADRTSKEALRVRLATEFSQLQEEYPAVVSARDLPKEVINIAVQKSIPLLDAYNRYTLKEQKRIASAMQKQADNRHTATGPMADHCSETIDPVWEAFLRGAMRAGGR